MAGKLNWSKSNKNRLVSSRGATPVKNELDRFREFQKKESRNEKERRKIIEAGKSAKGGYTRKQLKAWGIAWPPAKGWKEHLIKNGLPNVR